MSKNTAAASTFAITGDTILAGAQEAARKEKKAKRSKGKAHDQRGKDNGERARDAAPVAEAIIAEVSEKVKAEHALGHKIKELRDKGMAWWQIGHELGLPGSGPNVAQGKGGASRARTLYKKTFGELPGGTVARSTKASRAQAAATGEGPVVRKPLFSDEELADFITLADRCKGHEIRWVGRTACADGSTLETEREARVHAEGVTVEATENGPVLHFREVERGDRRAQQYRSVRLADVYDIRK